MPRGVEGSLFDSCSTRTNCPPDAIRQGSPKDLKQSVLTPKSESSAGLRFLQTAVEGPWQYSRRHRNRSNRPYFRPSRSLTCLPPGNSITTGAVGSLTPNPNLAAFSASRIAPHDRHTATPSLIDSPHAGHSAFGFASYSHGFSNRNSRAARLSRSVMNIGFF